MNRYFSSFVISLFVYVGLFAGAVVFFDKDTNFSDKDIKKQNVISVCMITQKPKIVEKPLKKKKIIKKKKIVKKPKPKKIIKEKIVKKELPKPKKILPKEEVIKKEEVVEKEEVIEEKVAVKQPEIKQVQQVIAKEEPHINHDEIRAKQNIFFTKLRNKINENKSYPRRARRRGIEGSVEVKFYIQSNGDVKNIEFVSGKGIFKKSALEAIENSFPVEVDKTLFSFPKEFKISIEYILS
ncbi:MAG: energy transducer TonB [Thiovulaceae bacterium]|nr:energy transducer TonB [Sulfurimonadaceae bacterium]